MSKALIGIQCIALVIVIAVVNRVSADQVSISQRFELFTKALQQAKADETICLKQLHAYPTELLTADSQYPQLDQYSWADLEKLHTVHTTCQWFEAKQKNLQVAINFEWSLCKDRALKDSWWQQAPLLHPAGGSYGDRYLSAIQARYGRNSDEETDFLTRHSHLLTLKNPQHPLHDLFISLDDNGLKALLTGYHFFLASDNGLWIGGKQAIIKVNDTAWLPVAKKMQLVIKRRNDEQFCPVSYGNLCVMEPTNAIYVGWAASVIFFLIAVISIARALWLRQQETREKKFILQLLTHELRTPVASLNMTVEQFRNDFDQLSEKGQMAFGRLLQDCSRLHRLTETSKGFLSNDAQSMMQCQLVLLSEWVEDMVDNYPVHFTISEDRELSLPWYWLGLCLDNLLRNALAHGQPPVSLIVSTSESILKLEVLDQGVSPSWWHSLIGKSSKNRGMGIGLTLVKRIMHRLGGRLIYHRHPTRYILELHYDKTTAG